MIPSVPGESREYNLRRGHDLRANPAIGEAEPPENIGGPER